MRSKGCVLHAPLISNEGQILGCLQANPAGANVEVLDEQASDSTAVVDEAVRIFERREVRTHPCGSPDGEEILRTTAVMPCSCLGGQSLIFAKWVSHLLNRGKVVSARMSRMPLAGVQSFPQR